MKYNQFGNSGCQVSHLGLSTKHLPVDENGAIIYEKAVKLIRKALDAGINVIDTHPNFCSGGSEIAIGTAIKGYDRGKFFISTKNPIKDDLGPGMSWSDRVQQSLERMHTDYVDFYLIDALCLSSFVQKMPLFIKEVFKMKEEGLIRHLGFSTIDVVEHVEEFIDSGEFELIMVPFHLTDPRYVEILAQAREKGMGTMTVSPFGGGMHRYPHDITELLGAKTPEQAIDVSLRFALGNDNVDVVFSGMESESEVETNVKIASGDLSFSHDELEKASRMVGEKQKLTDLYCPCCQHCLPCPQGVAIPAIFLYRNMDRFFNAKQFSREGYQRLIEYGMGADKCDECGICEEKCPANANIVERLKECHEILTGEKLELASKKA
jgi:uncharacterized protein